MDNCVKYDPHPGFPRKVARKQIFAVCELWHWPWQYDPELKSQKLCVKYHPDPTWQLRNLESDTEFGYVCTVTLSLEIWPWVNVMRHPGDQTTVLCNIIQIQHGSEGLRPGHGLWECVQCDIDLWDMTFGQGHYTPLDHGQQLCKILSRSKLTVRSFGQDIDFGYVCNVTLTLEMWPWFKVITYPWVMDNNYCVK